MLLACSAAGAPANMGPWCGDADPGGAKAILLYAGKECSEEFNMMHDKSVVAKYAADTIIGTLKE